jgi:hypothetical protein
MNPVEYAVVFIFGAAVLALWIDTRFRSLTPAGVWLLTLHMGAAFVLVQILPPLGRQAIQGVGPQAASLLWLFGFVFPGLTYLLLASIWVVKWAQGALANRFH